MEKEGTEITRLSDTELKTFKESSNEIAEEVREEVGEFGDLVFEEVLRE